MHRLNQKPDIARFSPLCRRVHQCADLFPPSPCRAVERILIFDRELNFHNNNNNTFVATRVFSLEREISFRALGRYYVTPVFQSHSISLTRHLKCFYARHFAEEGPTVNFNGRVR